MYICGGDLRLNDTHKIVVAYMIIPDWKGCMGLSKINPKNSKSHRQSELNYHHHHKYLFHLLL